MTELHHHCQCDYCSGEDCGQDDPEKFKEEREKEQREHDAAIAAKAREEVLIDIETYVKDGLKSCDKSEAWDAGYGTCCGDVLQCIENKRGILRNPQEREGQ